ncbi:FAD-binding oxidoreductase [Ferrimonas gelatinilytica]|uniref:FAD-binding oxidoreductase n=1 Tax=Ferrimonas gelatinilytica TaxID=1255257 RepID=A0ABP9RVZ3_9GAMM
MEQRDRDLIAQIEAIVGPKGLLLGRDVTARPHLSWGRGQCPAKAIVRPGSTSELSQVMALCHRWGQSVVPWGGMSGLVNGAQCEAGDLALSLERMNRIEQLESDAGVMTVQAGAVLQQVQQAAEEAGWQFAVDLGARGSAQIGGMVATNAGGNSVVRYGMMREQVLGLEVVLADGTVLSSLNEMLKNNAGYDLKQMFIGSEGTLGIVTRAVLRLRPRCSSVQTALVALSRFEDVVTLLRRLGGELDGKLTAFEVMWQSHYHCLVAELAKHPAFLPTEYPFYVLVEASGSDPKRDEAHFMTLLESLLSSGTILDAVIAHASEQAAQLWALRDDAESLIKHLGPVAVFDISLPIRTMEAYITQLEQRLAEDYPASRLITFGHLGDGNLHLGIGPVEDKTGVESLVYRSLSEVNGSISAEHGIGLEKKPYLHRSRSEVEIQLMKKLKALLDPKGVLNPGKIF